MSILLDGVKRSWYFVFIRLNKFIFSSARKRNKGLCLREQDSEEESDASLEDVDVDDADVEKFDPEYPNEGSKQMEESTKRVDEIWSAMKEEGQLRKV